MTESVSLNEANQIKETCQGPWNKAGFR